MLDAGDNGRLSSSSSPVLFCESLICLTSASHFHHEHFYRVQADIQQHFRSLSTC